MDGNQKSRLLLLRSQIVDSCSKCGGMGYTLNHDGGEKMCSCMMLFRFIKALVLARIPQAYWPLGVNDSPIDPDAIEHVLDYIVHWKNVFDKGVGLLMCGPNGTGKTTLMCEIGKHAIVQTCKVGYITAQTYIGACQVDDEEILNWVESLEVILLDELDKPYIKDGSTYVSKRLEEFVRRAIMNNRVLVMASNEAPKGLEKLYGVSFLSALERTVQILPVTGSDLSKDRQKSLLKDMSVGFDFSHEEIATKAEAFEKMAQIG